MPATAIAITILLNGTLATDNPVLRNGYTMVSVRPLMEQMGAKVDFDAGGYDLYITYNGKRVNLKGYPYSPDLRWSGSAKVQGQELYLRTDHSYTAVVPVRFLSEIFDFPVQWDNEKKTVIINTHY
jgi:hypothetical protein